MVFPLYPLAVDMRDVDTMTTPSEPRSVVLCLEELVGEVLSKEHEEEGCVGVVRDELLSLEELLS